jgi:TonB family protein
MVFNYLLLFGLLTPLLSSSLIAQNPEGNAAFTDQPPTLVYAEMPIYPTVARAIRMGGTVVIKVVINNGDVTTTTIQSDTGKLPILANSALANVRTWKFREKKQTEFLVTYIFEVGRGETDVPENAVVYFEPPKLVRIRVKPVKKTRSY